MATDTPPKVLITGSEGFLGSRLQTLLADHGVHVVKFDLTLGHDVRSVDCLEQVMARESGLVGVIHLAAVANLNFFHRAPAASKAINIGGTKNVLAAAKKQDLWVMFASTCCAYGNNHCHPSDETSPLCPTEEYAMSKAAMEPFVLESDRRNVVMRLATFYGPHMRPELSVAKFMAQMWHGETISVHGTGSATRTLTHCDDITSGIVTLVCAKLAGRLGHRIFNITTEESVSILDQIAEIAAATGRVPQVVHVLDRPFQIQKEQILSKRLQRLGWSPKFTFAAGVQDCFRQFRRNGYTWKQSCGVAPEQNNARPTATSQNPCVRPVPEQSVQQVEAVMC